MVRDIMNSHEAFLSGVSKSGDEIMTYQLINNTKKLTKVNL
jgi:hypothetical protein